MADKPKSHLEHFERRNMFVDVAEAPRPVARPKVTPALVEAVESVRKERKPKPVSRRKRGLGVSR